jgi:hypothetical protein
MIFYHDIRITAEDANGAIVEFAAVYLLDDVLSMSRGMLSSRDAKIPGSVNGPAGEKPDYVLVAQYAGDAKMVLSTIKGDMDVHLDPGATFALAGGGTFTPTTNGALTKVDSEDIEWSGDPGSRGAQWEYIAFTLGRHVPTGPCEIAQQTEGCQYFTFDYDGDTLLAVAIDASNPQEGNYLTVVAPDGEIYTVASGDFLLFEGNTHDGSYCGFSSDAEGNPQAQTWSGLNMLSDVEVGLSNIDLSNVLIVGVDEGAEQLSIQGASFTTGPDYRYMTALQVMRFTDCTFISLPVTAAMTWLVEYGLQRCGLSLAPSFLDLPNITALDLANNNLPASEVNRVLEEASATFTSSSGVIGIAAQTPPAPPSGPGLTAKAELEGRSPGWTVTVD